MQPLQITLPGCGVWRLVKLNGSTVGIRKQLFAWPSMTVYWDEYLQRSLALPLPSSSPFLHQAHELESWQVAFMNHYENVDPSCCSLGPLCVFYHWT